MKYVEKLENIVRSATFGAVIRAMNEAKNRLNTMADEDERVSVEDAMRIPSGGYTSGDLLLDAALLAVVAADALLVEGLWQRGELQLPADADVLKALELLAGGRLQYVPVAVHCDQDAYGYRLPEGEEIQGTIYWSLSSLERLEGPDAVYDARLLGDCESPFDLLRQAFGLTF